MSVLCGGLDLWSESGRTGRRQSRGGGKRVVSLLLPLSLRLSGFLNTAKI
jgi:hypothetical protein